MSANTRESRSKAPSKKAAAASGGVGGGVTPAPVATAIATAVHVQQRTSEVDVSTMFGATISERSDKYTLSGNETCFDEAAFAGGTSARVAAFVGAAVSPVDSGITLRIYRAGAVPEWFRNMAEAYETKGSSCTFASAVVRACNASKRQGEPAWKAAAMSTAQLNSASAGAYGGISSSSSSSSSSSASSSDKFKFSIGSLCVESALILGCYPDPEVYDSMDKATVALGLPFFNTPMASDVRAQMAVLPPPPAIPGPAPSAAATTQQVDGSKSIGSRRIKKKKRKHVAVVTRDVIDVDMEVVTFDATGPIRKLASLKSEQCRFSAAHSEVTRKIDAVDSYIVAKRREVDVEVVRAMALRRERDVARNRDRYATQTFEAYALELDRLIRNDIASRGGTNKAVLRTQVVRK